MQRRSSGRAAFTAGTIACGLSGLLALGFVAAVSLPAGAQTAAPPVSPALPKTLPGGALAIVDGTPITEADVAAAVEELGSSIPQQMGPAERRAYVIDYLVDLRLIARAAEQAKIGDAPEFRKRLEQARERMLMESLLNAEGEKGATEEAMRKFYDDTVKTLKPEQEVRARHILVETEAEAKAVLERLRKGEDFAKVAAEVSKDPGSGKEGGDLGYFTRERMVAEFAKAAFETPVGQLSEIVKSQFGFHVIRVEDKRDRAPPAFEAVKEQLKRYMMQKAQQDFVLKLRAAAKIERTAP